MLWCLRLWAALIPQDDLKLRCSTALLTQQLFFSFISHIHTKTEDRKMKNAIIYYQTIHKQR